MTVRAVILGLLSGVLLGGLGYLNARVLRLPSLVTYYFPISIFGPLILVSLGLNPVLSRLRAAWRLRAGELATVVALSLIACSIPSNGLMRFFTVIQVLPAHYQRTEPGWQRNELIDYLPGELLPADGRWDERVAECIPPGGSPDEHFALSDVPWSAWAAPLASWSAILLVAAAAVFGLSLVLHRQWAHHEGLRYPIARFADAVLHPGGEGVARPLTRNGLFWTALLIVLSIRAVNALHAWYPGSIEIPLRWNVYPIMADWTYAKQLPRWWIFILPTLYPTVIGFAYFLASDVSFTVGISHFVYLIVGALLLRFGVDLSYTFITGEVCGWQFFGSYLGLALIIAYTGRRYYSRVLAAAVGGWRRVARSGDARAPEVPRYAAWAARVFIVASGVLVWLLARLGLDWPVAVGVVVLLMVLYVCVARLTAEAGLFFIYAGWMPTAALVGFYGRDVLGPEAIVISGVVVSMLAVNPTESLMPFVMNGIRIGDACRVRPARLARWGMLTFVLALGLAIPAGLWADYKAGITEGQWTREVAARPFEAASEVVSDLRATGTLDEVRSMGGWRRLMSIRPESTFFWAAGIGLALVLITSLLRLRLPWWPIHPILFLIWGEWPAGHCSFSFFLGWMIKRLVTWLGGGRSYEKFKPLMIGLIAGDLLGGLGYAVAAALYYGFTGSEPPAYRIFP